MSRLVLHLRAGGSNMNDTEAVLIAAPVALILPLQSVVIVDAMTYDAVRPQEEELAAFARDAAAKRAITDGGIAPFQVRVVVGVDQQVVVNRVYAKRRRVANAGIGHIDGIYIERFAISCEVLTRTYDMVHI